MDADVNIKLNTLPKKEILTEVDGRKIKLTNLEKLLYPSVGITKAEIISYYLTMAPHILQYICHRPLTLIRFPNGVHANRFYSKNKPHWTPSWMAYVKISPDDDNTYIMANEPAALAWTANLASLELHPMQIKDTHLDSVDHFIFDLDPPETADFEVVKQLALRLRPFLVSYGYHPFVKTSGSKGLHIYVPIFPKYSHETMLSSVKALATAYLKIDDTVTLKMSKEKRKGKVLLDIYRNHNSQTCVAPYSTRGKEGAPVSTPITWEELPELSSSQAFDIKAVLERMKQIGDPWKGFSEYAVTLHDQRKVADPADTLERYAGKRDFSKTSEPTPELKPESFVTTGLNRYVIQLHDASNLHYDLRLEDGGVLRSWAIPKGLPTSAGVKRLAIETEPHPLKYLSFQGVIPKSEYGGGEMWIYDSGTYTYSKKTTHKLKIELHGGKLSGNYSMINTRDKQWLVSTDISSPRIESVDALSPMLASMGDDIPMASEYSYEIKWDGIRTLVIKDGKSVIIKSRNGNDLTHKFPAIVEEFASQEPEQIIADGEIVVVNEDGTPNFGKVVGRMHLTGKAAIAKAAASTKSVFYGFDCLYLDGREIMSLPLEIRRRWLEVNLKIGEHVRYSQSFADGNQLLEAIKAQGMEGIMCKRIGSIYGSGTRSKAWLKIKVRSEDTALIVGYTQGKGDRSALFGSLHLAKLEDGALVYYGKVGTGYDHAKMKQIHKKISAVPVIAKPIVDTIEEEQKTTWISPQYACDLKYASMTTNNTYREPVFLRMYEAETSSIKKKQL